MPVKALCDDNETDTYALNDRGSKVTLVLEDLAEDLSLKGDITTVDLRSIKNANQLKQKEYQLSLQPRHVQESISPT